MLKHISDGIFVLCLFAGIVIMIGTVGASEHDLITIEQATKQALIGSLITGVGFIGLTITEDD